MSDPYVQIPNVSSIVSAAVRPLERNGERGYIVQLGLLDGTVHTFLIDQIGAEKFRGMLEEAMLANMFGNPV